MALFLHPSNYSAFYEFTAFDENLELITDWNGTYFGPVSAPSYYSAFYEFMAFGENLELITDSRTLLRNGESISEVELFWNDVAKKWLLLWEHDNPWPKKGASLSVQHLDDFFTLELEPLLIDDITSGVHVEGRIISDGTGGYYVGTTSYENVSLVHLNEDISINFDVIVSGQEVIINIDDIEHFYTSGVIASLDDGSILFAWMENPTAINVPFRVPHYAVLSRDGKILQGRAPISASYWQFTSVHG